MPPHPCLPQVESALNIQKLKPQIDAIKAQVGRGFGGGVSGNGSADRIRLASLPATPPP